MGPCASSFAAGASRSASCSHAALSQRARSPSGARRVTAHAASRATTRSMCARRSGVTTAHRSEEHTSELQSHSDLVCRLLLEKKKKNNNASRVGTDTYQTHVDAG